MAMEMAQTNETIAIQTFLERIPKTDPLTLATELADKESIAVLLDVPDELTICFRLCSKTVRLMHARDLDKADKKSYHRSARAKASAVRATQLLDEHPMHILAQQYLMAQILTERPNEFQSAVEAETATTTKKRDISKGIFATLRSLAREKYWLDMNHIERATIRQAAYNLHGQLELEPSLSVIKANWHNRWNNDHRDPDYFRNYLMDQTAAAGVWDLVDDDIFIVVDKNLHVISVCQYREHRTSALRCRST
jgi:hypothetical protein